MKAKVYRNIDVVRIPIKAGISEYYFPQNVAWAGEEIDEMVVVAPQSACIDPVDGQTSVLGATDVADLFFNIYSENEAELTHDLSFEQIVHYNNNVLPINAKINLALSKMYFTSAPASDGTLLICVSYGTKEIEDYEAPCKSVTITFPLDADEEINFQSIINTYLHAIPQTLRGIVAWDADANPAYVTLRDYALTYNLRNVPTELMRPNMGASVADDTQSHPMWLDALDIDFEYSHIRNAQSVANTQKLTFLY